VSGALPPVRQDHDDLFFTKPKIIAYLEQARDHKINLTQLDVEVCVQARDRGIGNRGAQSKSATFAEIGANLHKCIHNRIAARDRIGPNAAAVVILQRVCRNSGDVTFTSAGTLAALEAAGGRDTRLSARDLEPCVDAYEFNQGFEQTFVGDNPPPCTAGEAACQVNFVITVCCSTGETCPTVCARSCARGRR
jgi:hypothetical protein